MVFSCGGGASNSLISGLQILQNKAARAVTKLGWRTPVFTLLRHCGWMSVKQLVVYHSCLFIYKTLQTTKPTYFHQRFNLNVGDESIANRTRLSSTNGIRTETKIRSNLYKQNFSYIGVQYWNTLPGEIRLSPKLEKFKSKLRRWVKENIAIK